jgi:thioredoxin-related protein
MRMTKGPSRRGILTGAMSALLGPALPRRARAQAVLTEDGLHRQSWFIDSLLELADDLDAAARQGKRFVVMWEMRGCPYCAKTHEVNFARPDIAQFVPAHFDVLQLNILGDREVVDFDGARLPEKRLAAKYGVRGTPTFQFFREPSAGLAERKPMDREVARLFGYTEPDRFLATFKRVAEQKS